VSEKHDLQICILAITKNSENFNVVGHPFLMDYYSVFDMERGRIGFAPHAVSEKSNIVKGEVPDSQLSSSKRTQLGAIITWLIIFVCLAGTWVLYYFFLFDIFKNEFSSN